MSANATVLEGTVENGDIKVRGNLRLPERAKVYVVIPGLESNSSARIASPRLANPEQAKEFILAVEDTPDA